MSFLNPPRDWSVGEVLTAAHMDEISAALTALGPGVVGTTISGIQTAVGAVDGMRAMLRNNVGDRMALVYDSNLGKWVGPETSHMLIGGADVMTATGLASGAAPAAPSYSAFRSLPLPCKPWTTAGLVPQFRLRGQFGITFTGGTTTRSVAPFIYGFDAGSTNVLTTANAGTLISVTAGNAAPSFVVGSWDSPTAPAFDWMLPAFYLTATGTGTWDLAAKHVSIGLRWVSA